MLRLVLGLNVSWSILWKGRGLVKDNYIAGDMCIVRRYVGLDAGE